MKIPKEKGMIGMKKNLTLRRVGQFIVMTSTKLLDSFFSDDADQRMEQENLREIAATLQQAAQEKSLVVLKLESEKEVISGWVVGKKVGKDQVIIKVQNKQNQVRIIQLVDIERISILSPDGTNRRITR